MNFRMIATIAILALLAACGPAKLDGPLTQAKLDEVQAGCGLTGATLISALPGQKAKISIGGLGSASNADMANVIIKGKCLEDRLTALGVDHDVSMDMNGSQMQQQMQGALNKAFN